MATPADLSSAAEAYATQQAITAAAVTAAEAVRPQTAQAIATTVAAYQALAAQQAAAAVPAMLAEQGISAATAASAVASSLAGYTAAGYSLATAIQGAQTAGMLALMVASEIQDAGRNGAFLGAVVRPSVTGYVRMLNPPSCSRCVVLAGKFFALNQGFERHPSCDCRHIPTSEDSGDLTTNPSTYFDSLTAAEQDRIFTKAGAQAIRDGADIGQVVNARRGMSKGQVFGREMWHTLESVTRRSQWRRNGQSAARRPYRLMPESIYALAQGDRDEALRLLQVYGYIAP